MSTRRASAACDVLGCECRCHRRKPRRVPRLWTPGMDRALLDDLDAGRHVSTIAARMHLTEESVRWRVRQLGRSLRDGWRSRQEVAQVLGVGRRAVDRWWKDGLLPVRKHGTRWTRILEAELETFVRAQAGLLFAPGGVRDARLRRLAEIGAAANARAVREEAS